MPIEGKPRRYHKKFLFGVEIDGLEIAHFSKCSTIKRSVGVVEQHEGGKATVANQGRGKVKWDPVTLEAGMTDNDELYEWSEQVSDSESDTGEVNDEHKKNVSIIQRDRDGTEILRWDLFEAWPSEYEGGDWDASEEANVVEKVVLTFRYAKRQRAA